MNNEAAVKQQLLVLVKANAVLNPDKVADAMQRESMQRHRAFAEEVLAASEAPGQETWADQLHLQVTAHAHGVAVEGQVEGAAGENQIRVPAQLKRTIASEWLVSAGDMATVALLGETPSDKEQAVFARQVPMGQDDMRRCRDQAIAREGGQR